jgi:uncharacterized membrane protein YgdD (TMEM256/DUF423 family)
MNQRIILLSGTLFSGLGVALGAFGAHALKPMLLANNRLDVYETAVRYQVYHALALLIAGVLMTQFQNTTPVRWAAFCWVGGILLFSGSLYALSFTSMTVFAFLTPVGGFLFLAGWGFMLWSLIRH